MKSDYTQFVQCRLSSILWYVPLVMLLGHAQGIKTKEKATDYPVNARLSGVELGAEYLVHSVPAPRGVIQADDYLVVEVAVFPPAHSQMSVNTGQFTLRINGKKSVLFPQTPGMVAASVKYPDWQSRPTLEASGGIGDTGVILGRPPMTGRFPGDNRPAQSRLPSPPRVPDQTNPNGEVAPPEESAEVSIAHAALPEGQVKEPVSGCLFFAFRGKTKSIHSLELLYQGDSGTRETTLRFF